MNFVLIYKWRMGVQNQMKFTQIKVPQISQVTFSK